MTPSDVVAVTSRPRPGSLIDWWCEQRTVAMVAEDVGGAGAGDGLDVDVAEHIGRRAVGGVPHLVWQVLMEGPAEVDVEDLAAAADGEDREVHAEGRVEQGTLALISHRVDPGDLGHRLLAVRLRRHIAPAGQHEGVEDGDDLLGSRTRSPEACFGGGSKSGRPPAAATSSK